MLSVDDACARILALAPSLPVESRFLGDAAGRILATDARAFRNLPPHDNSAMDGYGVRAADIQTASESEPVLLKVVGRVLPGADPAPPEAIPLKPGTAVRIMTGAKIPEGVDAVIMRENTDESGVQSTSESAHGTVKIKVASPAGEAIRRQGEDVRDGDVILVAGTRLGPAQTNLLAAAGHVVVDIKRRPAVAILASGDELKELGTPTGPDDIVNSNAHAVANAVRAAGGIPQLVGIASDSLDDHVSRIASASFADVLLTIGGVSMGTHDFVRPAFEELGVELDFWKVAMRPGKPLAFGRRGHQLVFGLPGNPVSTLVGFELFVRPAIAKMLGQSNVVKQTLKAKLAAGGMKKRVGFRFFARASVAIVEGRLEARLAGKQGSGQTSGMAHANALVVIPEDAEAVEAGQEVDVLLLDDRALFGPPA